ncbi:hypothetical protein [Winogradskyella forsetii]|uniref:hypothetical protein n=1 Tax=Winogradskyella forsetii TaxID=2686077 RepID=UPI0015B974B9|nr:hypothetical protein [Winogradskyella forsetii]
MSDVLIALIGLIGGLVPAILLHVREIKKKDAEIEKHVQEKSEHKIKADVLDKILDFSSFNIIKTAVDEIFEKTRADRFLILIAINGKIDFNMVSVIFEQHKDSTYQINAIARYRSLSVDSDYRDMLKRAERYDVVELETIKMEDSLLKDIYTIEAVKFSDIRHLLRIPADSENDILVYSSLATHSAEGFTKLGKRQANIIYDSTIKQTIKEVLQ